MAWCMRYCTVSIRSAPAPCRSARRSIRLSDSPSSAALPGESSEGARVPRQPEPGARQEAALKPQPTSLPELRERPPEGPTSTSEPQSWDPARPPGTEPPSAHRGMVPGPSSAPHSFLTSLGYHCSVQAPTNSRAVGVRGEGTPVPTANPEIHGTTQPTRPPNHLTSPRHSSVRLPKGTRSTQRAAPQGPSGLLGNQPLSPGPRALLLDSIHAHPYPDIWFPQDSPPKHTPIPTLSSPKSPLDPHSEAPGGWTPSPCGTLTCTPLSAGVPLPSYRLHQQPCSHTQVSQLHLPR